MCKQVRLCVVVWEHHVNQLKNGRNLGTLWFRVQATIPKDVYMYLDTKCIDYGEG